MTEAMTEERVSELTDLIIDMTDTRGLSNQADGKTVVLSEEDRAGLTQLLHELLAERKARKEAWEVAGTRASEILRLRTRIQQLEEKA